jgi:ATP-dependent exoDNAse (exonuclease V) alpha subunit
MNTDTLEFTEEFANSYELMEQTAQCVFITGKAGTGKSTLLNYFKTNTSKEVVVLAPTGVAALNVGGATLHSFFRLPPRPIHPDEIKAVSPKRRKLYQQIETIVIDEVSMVRADLMDVIDRFLRFNGRDRLKPFGGVQMIFIGDLFQLPPVVSSNEEARLFATGYRSPFFFDAHVFQEIYLRTMELTKVYRQKEEEFIKLLNAIRNNQATLAEIQQINQRYQPQFVANVNEYYLTLTTTNQLAANINTEHLAQFSSPAYQFEGKFTGKFEAGNLPTEEVLTLKEGAQVMFVKNDSNGRWVNGTLGKVKKLNNNKIVIETADHDTYSVDPVKWEILEYKFDEGTQTVTTGVTGSFKQYPLRLASAMTIHKSQGKQFEKVMIDLGSGTFAHGQLYVAISRCKTLAGLVLKRQVRLRDVIVDKRVVEFCASGNQPSFRLVPIVSPL